MEMYGFQRVGVEWLAGRDRAGLFDDQGLGKTITALGACERDGDARVLVLAPTVAIWNWAKEIETWCGSRAQVIAQGRAVLDPLARFVVCTHGLLLNPSIRQQILGGGWSRLIVDESHAFRGPSAKRSRVLWGDPRVPDFPSVVRAAEKVTLLTGTPQVRDCSDLWYMLRGLWPERILAGGAPLSYNGFVHHFCVTRVTKWGRKIIGNKNVEALRARLRGIGLRRLKRDVLPDLPPVRSEFLPLRPVVVPWELEEVEREIRPSVLDELRELDGVAPERGFTALGNKLAYGAFRRLCGIAKAGPAADLIVSELEGGLDKLVVFAHHLDVIESIRDRVARAIGEDAVEVIAGSVNARRRSEIVERFQDGGALRVVIGQILAAGTAITLTAAQEILFVELDPLPALNAQALDRVVRIGQDRRVRARFITLAGSVDEGITRANAMRVQMQSEILPVFSG